MANGKNEPCDLLGQVDGSHHRPIRKKQVKPKNIPQTLTLEESEKLLEHLMLTRDLKRQSDTGVRDYTMALMMLDAGLRVGELVQLYVTELWFQEMPVNTLTVTAEIAKGHRPRDIPLTARLKQSIVKMNQLWWKDDPHNMGMFAFYCYRSHQHITVRQVHRIIADTGTEALNKNVHPHILRHTFATRLMRKTNARVVQQLLGHRRLSSTQIYCHPNAEDLKLAIDSLPNGKSKIV